MNVVAPWAGRIAEIHVGVGDAVTARQELVTIESMKTLLPVMSPRDGVVRRVATSVDEYIEQGTLLLELD